MNREIQTYTDTLSLFIYMYGHMSICIYVSIPYIHINACICICCVLLHHSSRDSLKLPGLSDMVDEGPTIGLADKPEVLPEHVVAETNPVVEGLQDIAGPPVG